MPEVTPIRNPLDVEKVSSYLANLPETAILGTSTPSFAAPFDIQQFSFGQSNPTYLLQDANGVRCVLRRKPTANAKLVSKSAHAVEREFFILDGIAKCNAKEGARQVPVPKVYVLCEDELVVGKVFYVMEYVEGRHIKRPEMPDMTKEEENQIWEAAMSTIGAIHSVDGAELVKHLPAKHFPQFQPEKLKGYGQGPSYFQRQIKTLTAVSQGQAKTVSAIPNFDRITEWTLSHAPKDPTSLTLVHGDCKIDNFMFHPTEPRVLAVLDWELCTFGHPLFDLANFLQPYILPNALVLYLFRPHETEIGIENPHSADKVNELLDLYQRRLGHQWREGDPKNNPIDLWRLGAVFGLLRLCVISQGVAMRVANGLASSALALGYAELYKPLSDVAVGLIEKRGKL